MSQRPRPKSKPGQAARRGAGKSVAGGKSARPGKRPAKGPPRGTRKRFKGKRSKGGNEPNEFGPQRLQKVLAAAGQGSRRECETLITSGRVQVDGKTVTELGSKVDPETQQIRVDGEVLAKARKVYFLVNKPPGVLSTNRDPAGRARVVDLVPQARERVFAVGRLDQSSEGLILVTNDGELANQVTHPRYGVEKKYQVLVAGTPSPESLERLLGGIHLAEGMAKVDRLEVKTQHAKSTLLEMVLSEGRNREIRRLLARVGHKVLRLRRVAIGRLKLRDLKPGESRRLTGAEVEQLREAVHAPTARPTKRTVPPRSPGEPSLAAVETPSRPAKRPSQGLRRNSSEMRGGGRRPGKGRPPGRPASKGGAAPKKFGELKRRIIADDA